MSLARPKHIIVAFSRYGAVCNVISSLITSEASAEVLDDLGTDPVTKQEQEEQINWKDAWYAVSFMEYVPRPVCYDEPRMCLILRRVISL